MRGQILSAREPLVGLDREQDLLDITPAGATRRHLIHHGSWRAYVVVRVRVPQPVARLLDWLFL